MAPGDWRAPACLTVIRSTVRRVSLSYCDGGGCMAISMRQLAKIAGVSVATVSYALRDDPRISAATRQ
ncbi:MAG: LacI family DNA-binding transcriptional regulator, partial [Bacillota bacterium]